MLRVRGERRLASLLLVNVCTMFTPLTLDHKSRCFFLPFNYHIIINVLEPLTAVLLKSFASIPELDEKMGRGTCQKYTCRFHTPRPKGARPLGVNVKLYK